MELFDTEKEDTLCVVHTQCLLVDTFIAGLALHMVGFVNNKKKILCQQQA